MPGILDADTHIIEPREMWEDFDKERYDDRPVVVDGPNRPHWLIDGKLFPNAGGRRGYNSASPLDEETRATQPDSGSRELLDIPYRLRDMDQLGVDIQVIYPTVFLAFITDDVGLDVALAKAYNRFMAKAYEKSGGRLLWTVVPPLCSIDATIKELQWGKEHGAVGIFFRGLENDLSLDDPYFFPVYEEASSLDLPICIHTGGGSPTMTSIFDINRSRVFPHVRMLPLMAFRNLVSNNIPEMFPKLRFGFIETGASWVPYVLKAIKRGGGRNTRVSSWGPELFRTQRLFVSYEVDEDLPYLLNFIGEDNILLGTDYGHTDQSSQIEMISDLRSREELPSRVIDKLLVENPRCFYGVNM
jgi:predicted TIM-barrel fold metal-dependent hydrolase